MKYQLSRIKALVSRIHRDDRGAEGLEKLLIIGAIVLPLLGLLIVFRAKITEWLQDAWGTVEDDSKDYDPDF